MIGTSVSKWTSACQWMIDKKVKEKALEIKARQVDFLRVDPLRWWSCSMPQGATQLLDSDKIRKIQTRKRQKGKRQKRKRQKYQNVKSSRCTTFSTYFFFTSLNLNRFAAATASTDMHCPMNTSSDQKNPPICKTTFIFIPSGPLQYSLYQKRIFVFISNCGPK